MSSHDLTRRGVILAAVASMVAACQVRPVYMAPAGGGPGTAEVLRTIAIEAQTDRVAQVLMNALVFELRGGAALADAPRYTLHLIVTSNITDLTIEKHEDVPAARLVALSATYTLTETANGRAVANGTVGASTSYDFSSQRYANLRAERDALDKVAKTAAVDIRMRLSLALAPKG